MIEIIILIITIMIYNNNRNNNVSKVVDFILFADDTDIFISHKHFHLLSVILNSEMLKLTQWCRGNKLSINYKSRILWF